MHTRQLWLDLARGIAVISMVVAHTAPAGGLFNVTEYLTAPLFAAAIGAGVELAWRSWGDGAARFVGASVVRGLMLVVAGVLLQPVYWQIVVVLQWLGVLTALLAMLVVLRARGWIAIGASLGVLALAYPLMVATRGAWLPPGSSAGAVEYAVEYIASGGPYRLLPLLSAGLLGVGLTHWLGRDTVSPRSSLLVAVLAGGGAAIVVVIGKATALGADPYSGTYPEMLASLCLVTMTLSLSRWLTDSLPDSSLGRLDPIVATGRMAMTAYVLQSVVLRILADAFLGGSRDDHWWVLATTLVVLVGGSWAWRRFVGQGPFEWLLRVHLPLFRRVPVS